tara:strand:- start:162 stop:518 length:357 start_codon:yes stop_codon:yes gene_type:complete
MSEEEKQEYRKVCEEQYRLMIKSDIKYKFLPSLGMTDIMQGFKNPETGDIIGILHLRWKRGNDGKCSYHSTWYDNPNDGFELIKDIQSKRVYKQHMLLEASKRKMFFMTGPKKDETFN